MKTGLVKRLERLEIVKGFQDSNRRLKIEFAYLKQLPREYAGPRHIVTVGRRADGREILIAKDSILLPPERGILQTCCHSISAGSGARRQTRRQAQLQMVGKEVVEKYEIDGDIVL